MRVGGKFFKGGVSAVDYAAVGQMTLGGRLIQGENCLDPSRSATSLIGNGARSIGSSHHIGGRCELRLEEMGHV